MAKNLKTQNQFRQTVLDALLEKGRVSDAAGSFTLKNGEKVPVSFSGSVIKDVNGKIVNLVIAVKDLREIKKYAADRLSEITPVLQKISMGDFSASIEIPKEEDEFTEHLVALNLMVDDLRETVGKNVELVKALEKEKASLEQKVEERTVNLDAANQQLKAGNQQLEAANQQLAAAQAQLQDKIVELERFNKITMGRELKILELKEEVARLKNNKT